MIVKNKKEEVTMVARILPGRPKKVQKVVGRKRTNLKIHIHPF